MSFCLAISKMLLCYEIIDLIAFQHTVGAFLDTNNNSQLLGRLVQLDNYLRLPNLEMKCLILYINESMWTCAHG